MKNAANRKRRSADAEQKKDALENLKVASQEMVSGSEFQSETQKIIDTIKANKNELPYPTFMKSNKARTATEFEL